MYRYPNAGTTVTAATPNTITSAHNVGRLAAVSPRVACSSRTHGYCATPQPSTTDATANTVAEGAAVNTLVGITVSSTTSANDPPATYSLTDSANGAFKIDAVTGVVSVADPTKIDYETAPGHTYTIVAQASDGVATSTQSFIPIRPMK